MRLVASESSIAEVAEEFVDNDVSALSRKPRPAFTEMMRRADAGQGARWRGRVAGHEASNVSGS